MVSILFLISSTSAQRPFFSEDYIGLLVDIKPKRVVLLTNISNALFCKSKSNVIRRLILFSSNGSNSILKERLMNVSKGISTI